MTNIKLKKEQSFLPNAPLVEVIFELRWKLQGDNDTPAPFWVDPGYPILANNFTDAVEKHGFKISKKISRENFAHAIGMRFIKAEDKPFPLWQIGPGIFAANESASYTWQNFKKHSIDGVKILLSSYPKIKGFDINPTHLELRYHDSFDDAFITNQDTLRFLNDNSTLNIQLPTFFNEEPLVQAPNANLIFEFPISNMKDSIFAIRIANAKIKNKTSIILESRVVTKADPINFGDKSANHLRYINNWLESAHKLVSPFFKQFVNQSLMDKFKRQQQ
jgi:uncharacterized protein (TIGR04255 family)